MGLLSPTNIITKGAYLVSSSAKFLVKNDDDDSLDQKEKQ